MFIILRAVVALVVALLGKAQMDDFFADANREAEKRNARFAASPVPIFGAGNDDATEAYIKELGSSDWIEAAGFKDAAQALFKYVESREGVTDTLVFPIVFCYRHYLELSLKIIVRASITCGKLQNDSTATKVLNDHNLQDLWALVLQGLDKSDRAIERINSRIVRVGIRIDEWQKFDPKSFNYRYSRDKAGNERPFPNNHPQLSLRNFIDGMNDVASVLDEIDEMWDQLYRYEADVKKGLW